MRTGMGFMINRRPRGDPHLTVTRPEIKKALPAGRAYRMQGLRLTVEPASSEPLPLYLSSDCFSCDDGHVLLRADALLDELDIAIDQGEQGVILAHANVGARTNRGTALTHDDAAGVDRLAAVDFHAEAFAF